MTTRWSEICFLYGAGGDIIIADGNSGGLLDGAGASVTDPLIVDGPATSIGNTASLRIDHTGLWLGSTATDSTGRGLALEVGPPTQYLNPLYSADYTALRLGQTEPNGTGEAGNDCRWNNRIATKPIVACGRYTWARGRLLIKLRLARCHCASHSPTQEVQR